MRDTREQLVMEVVEGAKAIAEKVEQDYRLTSDQELYDIRDKMLSFESKLDDRIESRAQRRLLRT